MLQHPTISRLLDATLPAPEENLALDDALFSDAEAHGGKGILRLWEPTTLFIVLGYTNSASAELKLEACRESNVPFQRRISGGGTVLQGPGCLDYALILPIDSHSDLATISGANRHIMSTMRSVLSDLLPGRRVTVEGDTDLAVEGKKVSGNAQRRGSRTILFHGVFLLDFDLNAMERFLQRPSRQPKYRNDRPHSAFVANLGIPSEVLKKGLIAAWNAVPGEVKVPVNEVRTLVDTRYRNPSWTLGTQRRQQSLL